MAGSESTGGQLYAHLAQLLAPADSLLTTSSLVILEPAGKDVAAMGAVAGPAAAEALADLANAVPAAAASFLDTGGYYDDLWKFVLNSAVPSGPLGDPVRLTIARVLEDNRADFELMGQARFDLPTDLYHPVRAAPAGWLSTDGWTSVSFRIGGTDAGPAPQPPAELFIPDEIPELEWRELDPLIEQDSLVLEELPVDPIRFDRPMPDPKVWEAVEAVRVNQPVKLTDNLRWKDIWTVSRASEMVAEVTVANPPASGFELSFDYRVVGLHRPWLQTQLCHLTGWSIPGLPPGGISNGRLTDNPGLIPVLTTRMLVVRNLVVKAQWSDADRSRATSARTIAFGPFTLTGSAGFDGSGMSRPAPQVVAWLATVVAACPAG